MCMCLARGGSTCGQVGERIGFGLYQSWGNRGKVVYVCFWLQCWGEWMGGLRKGLVGWY